jgi:arylsulfatase
MKLLASDLGGTRNPMAIRWPAKITPDATPRSQFHHCNDVVPTIYEIVGITPPRVVNGVPQDPIDGVSFAYALDDPDAPGRLITQYFEIMGSRAIYHDGWMASATGPRLPWVPGLPQGIKDWTPDQDQWRLYNLDQDWTQANDLAERLPDKLAQMKETFAIEAARNSVYPVGGGLWIVVLHPELRISTPYREWNFGPDIIRMPEFCAPALGNRANLVRIDAELPDRATGVLYALGSSSGGLTCYLDDGYLCYEYNLFILMRTKIRTEQRLPAGQAKIEISTEYAEVKPGGPLNIRLNVNDDQVAAGTVPISAPLLFTANDCLDIGTCLGGPVSLDYYDRAPFPFSGTINNVNVRYTS